MKFLADSMLGRLARWLRFSGVDCAYQPDRTDEGIIARAQAEGRTLLTADRNLAALAPAPAFLVTAVGHRAQLREVYRQFALAPSHSLMRCGECNTPLAKLTATDVYGRVPLRVYQSTTDFLCCPSCSRIYWRGEHAESIERELDAVLGGGERTRDEE